MPRQTSRKLLPRLVPLSRAQVNRRVPYVPARVHPAAPLLLLASQARRVRALHRALQRVQPAPPPLPARPERAASMASTPRGLLNFIRDIRNCANKEDEKKRVNVELANIRTKFKSDKLSPYERKKYVWKLLYIYMLGYDVEFGHMEAVGLISSPKYAEKQVGYMVTSVLLNEHHEFLRLVINSIRNDITSRNDTFQALGLVLVSNVGGKEFAESLAADVQRLLVTGTVRPVVRKKAALCLLRLFRRNPDVLNKEEWADALPTLLDERDHGLLTSVLSFLHALVVVDSASFRGCLAKVVRLLDRLVRTQDVPPDYLYYSLPSPWMQIKCMRILQQYPLADDPSLAGAVSAVLQRIIALGAESVKNINKNNALQAVLFEAVGLVILLERDRELVEQMAVQLGRFIAAKEPNTRYLGLENMGRLSMLPQVALVVKRNQQQIAESLHDPDISIRRRALDLLYGMCDAGNAQDIVRELLDYLILSDFAIREELVLKIAILAEKYAPTQRWYIDVVLTMMDKAGDFVSDDIWHRVVQIVTNSADLQAYAAEQVLTKLREGSAHESMLKISGYLLGEFGHLLQTGPNEYFGLLQQRFAACSLPTKALLLSAYAKMVTHTSDAAFCEQVKMVFQRYHAFADVELQQRSIEYFSLAQLHGSTLKDVLAEMPKFPERASALERRIEPEASDAHAAGRPRADAALQPEPVPSVSVHPPAEHNFGGLIDIAEPVAVAPAAPPTHTSALNALDLLSQLDVQPPAPAAPDSLAGLEQFGSAAQSAFAVQPVQDTGVLLRKLYFSDSGVLYEDPYMQIGVKFEFAESQGRIALFLGNKHDHALYSLRLEPRAGPGIGLGDLSGVPPMLAPRQQIQLLLSASCLASFPSQSQSTLAVAYSLSASQQVSVTLQLPLLPTKFLAPAQAMENAAFYREWQALNPPHHKLESVVQVSPELAARGLAGWQSVFESLRLHIKPGVDPNPLNIFAASALRTAAGTATLCIVRLESAARNPAQFRLTVASADAVLAAAVRDALLLAAQA